MVLGVLEVLAVLLTQELLRRSRLVQLSCFLALLLSVGFESICAVSNALGCRFLVGGGIGGAVDFVEGVLDVLLELLSQFLLFFGAVLINLAQNSIGVFAEHRLFGLQDVSDCLQL